MKNRIVYLIVIMLTSFFVFLIMGNRKLTKKYNDLYGSTETLRVENILLKEGFFHSYDYETIPLDFSVNVQNYQLENLRFKDVLQNKKTLVFFVHVESCNSCTYDNIKKIKELKEELKVNILIGIEGLNNRKFQSFVTNNDVKDISYLLPEGFFEGFFLNPVVYFVVDESLEPRYFYAPSNNFPGLTLDYFNKVNRFF